MLRHYGGPDEEDELLQMAIQQSLLDSGTENEQVSNPTGSTAGATTARRNCGLFKVGVQCYWRHTNDLVVGASFNPNHHHRNSAQGW